MTYSYTFNHIKDLRLANLSNSFIWILYADKTPPHIGISVQGYFFSLKTEGKDENIPLILLQKILNKKKITSVAVEIENNISLKQVQDVFGSFTKIPEARSCLTPILTLLAKPHTLSTVSAVLKDLKAHKEIKAYFGLNLYPSFKGINMYSSKEIQQRINTLRNA